MNHVLSFQAKRHTRPLPARHFISSSDPCYGCTMRSGNFFLGIWRLFAVPLFSVVALLENIVTIPFLPRAKRLQARAKWLHRWCRVACRLIGLRVTAIGSPPESGLLVSNHLSYLDIIALSSLRPCLFVAKSDVALWPLFGWLATVGGTIFVDRERRLASPSVVERIRAAVANGALVVLFPEGTSSDGSTVLPFKSALLESASQIGSPITAGSIGYELDHGSVADEVCYWRDMTFAPHLFNLFFKSEIKATCTFSSPRIRENDRKKLARELRDEILSMRS